MSDFITSRPQRLCLMCGRCCRLATTFQSYEELKKLAQEGDKGAQDFLSIFEAYPSMEAAAAVDAPIVENLLKRIETCIEKPEKITFYKCKHIQDNNLCGIYENRLELCDRFPTSPWAIVPPGCGYEGYMFQCREEIKQKIRKHKEDILECEAALQIEKNSERKSKYIAIIEKTKNIIAHYDKYGAQNW